MTLHRHTTTESLEAALQETARLKAEKAALVNAMVRVATAVGMFYAEDQVDAIVAAVEAAKQDKQVREALRGLEGAVRAHGIFCPALPDWRLQEAQDRATHALAGEAEG